MSRSGKNNGYGRGGGRRPTSRGLALLGQEGRTPQVVEAEYCDLATRVVVKVLRGPAEDAPPMARPYMGGDGYGPMD